jgi:CRP-like cAMP-binding protein
MYIHPLLSTLPETVRKSVTLEATLRSFRKNEVVLEVEQYTDFVYCVGSGLLRVVSTGSDDADLTTHFLKPDEFHVGPDLSGAGHQSEIRLIAALPSSVYLIPQSRMYRLCVDYPAVALGLLDMKLRRVAQMSRQMRRVATLSAEKIVGRALYDLTQERLDGTRVLDKRIPQSVIASYAGLSRPVVNKVFKEMEEQGLIRRDEDVFLLSERVGKSTNFGSLDPQDVQAQGEQRAYAAPNFELNFDGGPVKEKSTE